MATLTASQKSQLVGISKTLGGISSSISSLSPSEKAKFESSSASNQLSSALGGLSSKVSSMGAPVIPVVETTQPVTPAVIPPAPQITSPDATTLAQQMRNLSLGLNVDGTQTINPNTKTTTPTIAPALTVGEKFAQDYGIPKVAEPKSVTEEYYGSDAYKNMVATQNRLTGLTGQLGAITASANQQQLALEGQGRGQTTAFLGGEGARIQREAAIASLPLQAQIAAEQGNLDLAKTHLDTWSRLMISDAEAKRQYDKQIHDNAMLVATTDQANKLKAADRIADQNFEKEKLAIQFDYEKRLKNMTGGGTGVSNQQTDNERALMSQFRAEPIVKDYNEVLGQKGTIDAYIQNGVGGPADLAMVFSFMKGLDPTSVVRESEYDTAAKSGNIFQGAFSKFNGYFKAKGGFLPTNVKTEFQNLVNQKLNVKQQQYNNVKKNYEGIAQRQGLNPQNVIIDYGSGAMPETPKIQITPEDNAIFNSVIGGGVSMAQPSPSITGGSFSNYQAPKFNLFSFFK